MHFIMLILQLSECPMLYYPEYFAGAYIARLLLIVISTDYERSLYSFSASFYSYLKPSNTLY
jgi:hypothetical protein